MQYRHLLLPFVKSLYMWPGELFWSRWLKLSIKVVSFTWSNSVNFCVMCHIYLYYFANSRKDKHRKFTPTPKNISLEALLRLKHSLFSYIIYLYLKSNKILKVDPLNAERACPFLKQKIVYVPWHHRQQNKCTRNSISIYFVYFTTYFILSIQFYSHIILFCINSILINIVISM